MTDLTLKDFKEKLKSIDAAILLDVRTPQEWQEGSIQGAEKIDYLNDPEFEQKLQKLDLTSPVFVYCRSGRRSAETCHILDGLGAKETYNLVGGILVWDEPLV